MAAITAAYSAIAEERGLQPFSSSQTYFNVSCEIVGFVNQPYYGKYPTSNAENTVIMEYDNLLSWLLPQMDNPAPPQDFIDFVEANPLFLE